MSSADINAINQVLGNIQSQINEVTGNTLSSYNQLSRIVAQQSNIYNTIYYGLGNLTTGNLTVNNSYTINGNLTYDNINYTGNFSVNNGNLLIPNGNLLSTLGNIVLLNGDILSTVGNLVISNGNIGIKRTNPQYELDINGSANISNNINMSGLISFASGNFEGISTTTQAQAYTNNTTAISPLKLFEAFQGSNQSLTENGYQKLPGGLIIQWGRVTANGTYSFPIPFPNAFLSMAMVAITGGNGTPRLPSIPTQTGFTYSSASVADTDAYWIAIGW